MRISFRYCGCCNPQLDLSQIEERLRQEGEEGGEDCVFLPPGEKTDLCILLNACPVGCADAQHSGSAAVKRMVVRGWKADGQPDWTWEKGGEAPRP
jgi:hypothetical protein